MTAAGAAPAPDLLSRVLPIVSRSFALSLRVLPEPLRAPLGFTYLLARAADTIADTRALPPAERRRQLETLRAALRHGEGDLAALAARVASGHPAAEAELLVRLPEVLAAHRSLAAGDRGHALTLLLTLTQAMLDALARFPPEGTGAIGALETRAELERYTYMNAGCVGEFWTDLVASHRPRCARGNLPLWRSRAVRFGQGLQLVNVLRDLPRDLRTGRCYLPRVELDALGLGPADLLDPASLARVRPLLMRLVGEARANLAEGLAYTLATPRREVRLRLAAAWPLLIGLATLLRLARAGTLLDPAVTIKVERAALRRLLAVSVALVPSNRALGAYAHRLAAAIPTA